MTTIYGFNCSFLSMILQEVQSNPAPRGTKSIMKTTQKGHYDLSPDEAEILNSDKVVYIILYISVKNFRNNKFNTKFYPNLNVKQIFNTIVSTNPSVIVSRYSKLLQSSTNIRTLGSLCRKG